MNKIVDKVLDIPLKNKIGEFKIGAYKFINKYNVVEEIIILYYGDIQKINNIRINSACYSSDLFHCERCDCHDQLEEAMKYFAKSGNGMLLYILNHDGRGCGTVNKLKSLTLMDNEELTTKKAFEKLGLDTDIRDYSAAIDILKDLNIHEVNVLTNNPEKIDYLEKSGIVVKARIPLICAKNIHVQKYLESKRDEFNHYIEV